ncbi:MAG: hypothetical protein CSA95_07975 [Bacteroidetes bacterium]|nr:MAG: hypothetical protein CSA95_07975 [Bacteroidota bacterium]PIE88218.1 MAG: hypothetical protein CSA04_03035 [Bacteroidota bacterium]
MQKEQFHPITHLLLVLVFVASMSACNHEKASLPDTLPENEGLPHATINRKLFHVETFGDPANPTVIVIHGGPGWDYTYMLPLANLSDRYFVVFYDQSGCGLSPRYDANQLTVANALEDLHQIVLRYHHKRRVNLIGHGYGAMLASAYVGQHPERVAYTVLVEPVALGSTPSRQTTPAASNLVFTNLVQGASHLSPEDHLKADGELMERLLNPKQFPAIAARNNTLRTDQFVTRPGAMASEVITQQLYDPQQGFLIDFTLGNQRFKNTILLLFSAQNPYFTPEKKQALQQHLQRSLVKTIPETGYFIFSDNPSATVTTIREYFNDTGMIHTF